MSPLDIQLPAPEVPIPELLSRWNLQLLPEEQGIQLYFDFVRYLNSGQALDFLYFYIPFQFTQSLIFSEPISVPIPTVEEGPE